MREIQAKTIYHMSKKKFDTRLGALLTEIGEERIIDIKVYSYAGSFSATVIYRGFA